MQAAQSIILHIEPAFAEPDNHLIMLVSMGNNKGEVSVHLLEMEEARRLHSKLDSLITLLDEHGCGEAG